MTTVTVDTLAGAALDFAVISAAFETGMFTDLNDTQDFCLNGSRGHLISNDTCILANNMGEVFTLIETLEISMQKVNNPAWKKPQWEARITKDGNQYTFWGDGLAQPALQCVVAGLRKSNIVEVPERFLAPVPGRKPGM